LDTIFGTILPDTPRHADAEMINAYLFAGRTLDDLPYTSNWSALLTRLGEASEPVEAQRLVFQRLLNLRKAGKLPRLGRAESTAVKVTPEEEASLVIIITSVAGSIGHRDRLPFTPAFDAIAAGFHAASGRELAPHEVWRLIAKVCK